MLKDKFCLVKNLTRRVKLARNLDPKCSQCRREGEKLFLKGEKCFTDKHAQSFAWVPPPKYVTHSDWRKQFPGGESLDRKKNKLSPQISSSSRKIE